MSVQLPSLNPDKPIASTSGFGRVFFGGGSTVYYSPVIEHLSDVGRCYQKSDPTSDEISDPLATDGGRIVLKNAGTIIDLFTYNTGVLVFTDRGIWYIFNNETGFISTSFSVQKITDEVLVAKASIVEANGVVYFGTASSLNVLYKNEHNNLQTQSITDGVIRKFYTQHFDQGFRAEFDGREKNIWFVSRKNEPTKDLCYNVVAKAFYPQDFNTTGEYKVKQPIVFGFDDIRFGVVKGEGTLETSPWNVVTLDGEDFKDIGVDTEAYLESGYETVQAPAKTKSIKYGTFFFNKTETQITGYDETSGEFLFDNPSSCELTVKWDFDTSGASRRFTGGTSYSPVIQLYKPMQRGFFPEDTFPVDFDTGESIITKKVKLRGRGKAVQFRFEAQPEKDMQLLGYSTEITVKRRQ